LIGKFEEKGLFGRPKLGWEGNFKIDLKDSGCRLKDVGLIKLVLHKDQWQAVGNMLMNLQTP
jgi:hypothetical protein